MLTTVSLPTMSISPPYVAVVLIEPTMVTQVCGKPLFKCNTADYAKELFNSTFDERIATMEFTVEATRACSFLFRFFLLTLTFQVRRDTWPSRQTAFQWMRNKFPWRNWDQRVLQLFTDYGLTPINSNRDNGPVKLKTSKDHEALGYSDVDGHFQAPLELGRVCKVLPVHIIWGDMEDLMYEFDTLKSFDKLRASSDPITYASRFLTYLKDDGLLQR